MSGRPNGVWEGMHLWVRNCCCVTQPEREIRERSAGKKKKLQGMQQSPPRRLMTGRCAGMPFRGSEAGSDGVRLISKDKPPQEAAFN